MQVDVADVLPPPRWTMSVALSRKRSRLGVDDDEEEEQRRREPSPAFSDTLKRSKTQCELEELDVIGASEAWGVDVDSILASRRIMKPGFEAHDNWARYRREESIVVLCVQGNVLVHYELLWYAASMVWEIQGSRKTARYYQISTTSPRHCKRLSSATILLRKSFLQTRRFRCP
jgi:hypothetical protein